MSTEATEIDPKAVLDLPMQSNDAGANTIRDYLVALLVTVWNDQYFSAKRPFGNSSWEYELFLPLIKAGMVAGTVDEDGHIEGFDRGERYNAHTIIADAIQQLGVTR